MDFENENREEYQENFYLSENTGDRLTLTLDDLTRKYIKWIALYLKVLGILTIIGGVIYTIFIIGIPLIFIGMKLFKSGDYLTQTLISKNEEDFKKFFEEGGKFVKYYVIYFIFIYPHYRTTFKLGLISSNL